MKLTNNLHLKKPGLTDKAKILDINDNMDAIDSAFSHVGTVIDDAIATKASTTTVNGNTITTTYTDSSKDVSVLSSNKIVTKRYDKNNQVFETITTVMSNNSISTGVSR